MVGAARAGTVCGHVHNRVTGKPIEGAEVRLLAPSGKDTGLATACDADGAWCIGDVPAGEYLVEARAAGYRIGVVTGVKVVDWVSGVEIGAQLPAAVLDAPWPNPAQGSVSFRVKLGEPASVLLGVYDLAGRRLRAWGDVAADTGERTVVWDCRDDAGRAVPAGHYFVRLEADGLVVTRTFVRVE